MFGHMMYFTSSPRSREEKPFDRPRPEDFVLLWGPNGRPQRSFGRR